MRDPLVESIDAILPQTQCRKCGFSGCKPYAMALVSGQADINQCPPGGEEGIEKLAQLLGVAAKPLNPEHGTFQPKGVAFIDESRCIGCACHGSVRSLRDSGSNPSFFSRTIEAAAARRAS